MATGPAGVDLPDPLDSESKVGGASSDATAGNADDLLSQMAGEEIDRLMKEAGEDPLESQPKQSDDLAGRDLHPSSGVLEPVKQGPATQSVEKAVEALERASDAITQEAETQ